MATCKNLTGHHCENLEDKKEHILQKNEKKIVNKAQSMVPSEQEESDGRH